jgi:hypothetical protein
MVQVDAQGAAALRRYIFPLQIVKLARKPFDGGDWLYEIKHDGFRLMAIRDRGPSGFSIRTLPPEGLSSASISRQ